MATLIGALPGMSFFYVQPLGEKNGASVSEPFPYFGLAENYDPAWSGRYYVQKSTLIGVSLLPTVSYQVNDWLALGAGLNLKCVRLSRHRSCGQQHRPSDRGWKTVRERPNLGLWRQRPASW